MMVPVMYEGGVYKHNHIIELVEDLGGYIIQLNVMQTEVVILMLVPHEDVPVVDAKAKSILGKITPAPLAGTEIATVAPTLAYHHLPHVDCDIAEYMRKKGAKTNMIGLARGVGIRICQLTAHERELINEHDLAIFIMGNYEHCIIEKSKSLYRDVEVPVIVTGASLNLQKKDLPYAAEYVGNFGRVLHQFRHGNELDALENLATIVGKVLDGMRAEIGKDPLSVEPPRIKKEIDDQIPEIHDVLSPLPIALQLRGARVKLPFEDFHDRLEEVKFVEGVVLSDIATVMPSRMKDYILIRILPRSETGFMI